MEVPTASTSKRGHDAGDDYACQRVKGNNQEFIPVYSLLISEDGNGYSIRASISVKKDDEWNITSISAQLRRYKYKYATKQGVALNVDDLKTIIQFNDHLDPDFSYYVPSHSLIVTTRNEDGETQVTVNINKAGRDTSIRLTLEEWRNFVGIISALRYIIKCLSKDCKDVIAEDILLVLYDDCRQELYETNKFEGSLEKEMLKVQPAVRSKMNIIERMLQIPRQVTLDIIARKDFISSVNKYSDYKSEAKNMMVKNVRLLLKNSL